MAKTPPTKSSLPALPGRGLAADEVELGKIVGVFGVQGEARVHLHNREGSVLLDREMDVVLLAPSGERFTSRLRCRSGAGRRVLGTFRGVSSREGISDLQGWSFAVPRAALPAPEEDEYYVADLQGLVVWVDGSARGRVVDVVPTHGGDVLELSIDGEPAFVPFSGPGVIEVDVPGGRIVIDPDSVEDL
jgi:16S rRNA processing protein RimM